MKEIDKLDYRPFTKFCMSIGAVPSSYLAGLSIEEQLLWFCSYLEKEVIPTVNNNGEAVEELQNLYVELKSYVDNYFENLDVQEEINNKLDELVEDGTLERIIGEFINDSIFINNITYEEKRDATSETTYYITHIPFLNEDGEQNVFKIGLANDNKGNLSNREQPRKFAIRKNATFCSNAGVTHVSTGTYLPYGSLIVDSEILQNQYSEMDGMEILGIKENGDFAVYDANNTNADTVLADGCINAFCGFYSLISGGQAITIEDTSIAPRQVIGRYTNGDYFLLTCNGRYPDDKGMSIADLQRVMLNDMQGVVFAYMLDGGGSTSTMIKYLKINKNIDNFANDRASNIFLYIGKDIEGHEDEKNAFAEASDISYYTNQKINSYRYNYTGYLDLLGKDEAFWPGISFYVDGEQQTRAGKISMNYDNGFHVSARSGLNEIEKNIFDVNETSIKHNEIELADIYEYCTNTAASTDLNNLSKSGFYMATSSTQNIPRSGNYLVFQIYSSSSKAIKMQIAIPIVGTNGYMYVRRFISNAWTDWQPLSFLYGNQNGRPTTNRITGQMYFDTYLGKPIWWDGTNWVDATGETIS